MLLKKIKDGKNPMKKHKILFAACAALFASICFLGCKTEDDFTEIDEFKPAAGTYDVEMTSEYKSKENGVEKSNTIEQQSGTLVIEGTNDDSKVSQTLSSWSVTKSFKSKDDYNAAKEQPESSEGYEYTYDDEGLTIKCTVTGVNWEGETTYPVFLSTFSKSEGKDIKFYSSSKGSYKIVISEKEEFTNEENEKVENESKTTYILTRK